jgi:hypothetical protein
MKPAATAFGLSQGTPPKRRAGALRLGLLAAALSAGLGGCASVDLKPAVREAAAEARKGPSTAPERTLTNFSEPLRCMDNLFIQYGIRDVSVLVDDLEDKTKRVSAGTRDMLISAASSMTQRSRAIRLLTFGNGSSSLDDWHLRGPNRLAPFAEVPLFAVRGSVSQFDQNVASREADAGVAFGQKLSVGAARRVQVSRMAIDLNVIYGTSFAIVPGVTSQNSILLYSEGSGVDGDATIRKFGINFNMTIAKTEGQAQGLRNLMDLAAIELFGRLSRTPYWTCLGSAPDAPEALQEMDDWYQAMEANGDLVPYIQYQLRNRGYFAGAVDAKLTPALAESVALYRAAMGDTSTNPANRGTIDPDFFKRYLSADHRQVVAKNPPPAKVPGSEPAPRPAAAVAPPAPVTVAAATPAPPSSGTGSGNTAPARERLLVLLESAGGERVFRRGQAIDLNVLANRRAHLTCFMRDEGRQVQRIFPNRFQPDSLVPAGKTLRLPGPMRFEIVASPRGLDESIVCFGTERDVMAQLPRHISGADFENLPVGSVDEIRDAFRAVTDNQFAEGVLHVRTR